jgi:Mycothiol maleylpyruvate isomerase N-terminal domain
MQPLEAIYGQLTVVADALTEASALLPSRCAGWAITDVLYHQLMDARRALVAFASPADRHPDTDSVSYWGSFAPARGDQAAGGGQRAAQNVLPGTSGLTTGRPSLSSACSPSRTLRSTATPPS